MAMHLALWYVVHVCHQYDVCKNYVGSVYDGGYGILRENGPCVFHKLCPVSFIVVRRLWCSRYSCRMLTVVMMDKWSDDSARLVVHDVRLYSVSDTVVISSATYRDARW